MNQLLHVQQGYGHLSESANNNESSNSIKQGLYQEYLQQCSQPKKEGSNIRTKCLNFCKCNPLSWMFSLFPILSWLPKYNFREDFSYDLISGITVCVMQIPQGMAYAMLASVQPVVGIYMSLFPIIIYSIMGTSRHISMGTFAITCLMTSKTVLELHAKYDTVTHPELNDTSLGTVPYEVVDHQEEQHYKYTPEQIATILSFVTGIIQLLMGTLRLGFLCVILSSDLVSGFTLGSAIHVLTSQIKSLLGLSIQRRTGVFKIPLTYYDIFSNIGNSNVTAVIFSVITLSCLMIYNEVLKPLIAKKISIPIPIELFAIVGGTLVSRYWITSEEYGIQIVNHIPTGFPPPALPPLELVKDVLMDSFIMAIVAFTISISMGKIFAAKHEYDVDSNQELLANGASNVFGSFFSCAPISCSLSRSVIQEQVGGRSQLAGLVSCVIMVFVLLWIAPFFETLPQCVLSSMIVVALRGMLIQLRDVPGAFRESLLNAGVWSVTFLATVFLDIEYGLGIGVIAALLNLIWRSNRPYCALVRVHSDSLDGSILVDASSPSGKQIPGIQIVKYTGSLNFATVEYFGKKLNSLVPPTDRFASQSSFPPNIGQSNKRKGSIMEGVIVSTISEEVDHQLESSSEYDNNEFSNSSEQIFKPGKVSSSLAVEKPDVNWLILDFSSVSSIDPAATKSLISLTKLYLKKDVNLIFVGCAPSIIPILDQGNLIKVAGADHFHPTVPAALSYLRRGLVVRRRSSLRPPLDNSYNTTSSLGISMDTSSQAAAAAEQVVVQDDGDFQVVGDTTAYFRRLSKNTLR
ncbi:prestin isoform X2 [Folsomia candida]|uniref:prestin isoform X2 n=1 Tax=Folsomia candida TaxID=158441 RepID=UPI000B905855|nr:prestin isoform X2 [Folsomia candida]